MDERQTKSKIENEAHLIAALYRWLDDENEAKERGQLMLAFFIGLVIEEIKTILKTNCG